MLGFWLMLGAATSLTLLVLICPPEGSDRKVVWRLVGTMYIVTGVYLVGLLTGSAFPIIPKDDGRITLMLLRKSEHPFNPEYRLIFRIDGDYCKRKQFTNEDSFALLMLSTCPNNMDKDKLRNIRDEAIKLHRSPAVQASILKLNNDNGDNPLVRLYLTEEFYDAMFPQPKKEKQ